MYIPFLYPKSKKKEAPKNVSAPLGSCSEPKPTGRVEMRWHEPLTHNERRYSVPPRTPIASPGQENYHSRPNPTKPRGFTLVELSIVLVITGVLVGAVVAGQPLIESAKVSRTVSEIQKLRMLVNVFDLQYDALPGDFSESDDYWGVGLAFEGDGNGKIEDLNSTQTIGQHSGAGNESFFMWRDLHLAGIIPQEYNFTGWPNAGNYAKESPYEGALYTLAYKEIADHRYNPPYVNAQNMIIVGGNNNGNYRNSQIAVLSSAVVKRIDEKFDDGVASSGKFFGVNSSRDDRSCNDSNWHTYAAGDYNLAKSSICTINYLLQ
jgi:prepilin-type N-terminal cleavage/methylation domain-containing protein